jgi:hypothetical protein
LDFCEERQLLRASTADISRNSSTNYLLDSSVLRKILLLDVANLDATPLSSRSSANQHDISDVGDLALPPSTLRYRGHGFLVSTAA